MSTWQEEYKTVVVKAVGAVVCSLVVAWIFLVPQFQELVSLRERIHDAEERLERQALFLPEYARLHRQMEPQSEGAYDVPPTEPVDVNTIERLPSEMIRLAGDAGLQVLDVVVSPGSLRTGQGRMMMQCVVQGGLDGFKQMYRALAALPYLDRVDRVEMRAAPGGAEFFLELWVLLEDQRTAGGQG
ncbi:hypothetical protein SAMN02745704_00595 [Paucidesulfovibrio gracilis DSM 16080]|uniref:Type IV pilus assembly protein PilO n=1 Tax=Paucidesulfovibrio gracilis DSM 16080 TaxID=1121449 RepID=A0A1T4W9V2_9BACT|nr:hypothetical protein [Paucidesulfovibrio gracilis]SKA74104.1 hypothetical protein SAMN02745704_00595 [Paucidesulfovibrio gracilis DSM 16080]